MKLLHEEEKSGVRQPEGVPGLPEPAARSWAGLGGMLLLIHAMLALAFVLLRRGWPELEHLIGDNTLFAFVVGGILMQGLLIFLPSLFVMLAGRIPSASVLGGKARAGSLILAFTAGIPAAVVFLGMNNLLIYVLVKSGISLPEPTSTTSVVGGDLFSHSWQIILLIVLVSVILPGLIEELMFRGVILSAFASAGAGFAAIFWQAVAFAVFHNDPLFMLPPFFAGLMLATIRQHSESLLPAVLAHMSLNMSLLVIAPLLPQLTAVYLSTAGAGGANSLLYASLIAACVAAVALVPLLVLITRLQVRRPAAAGRQLIWPADWKFALALLVLIVTIMLEYS